MTASAIRRPSISDVKRLSRFPRCHICGRDTQHALVSRDRWQCQVCGNVRHEHVWMTVDAPQMDAVPLEAAYQLAMKL